MVIQSCLWLEIQRYYIISMLKQANTFLFALLFNCLIKILLYLACGGHMHFVFWLETCALSSGLFW